MVPYMEPAEPAKFARFGHAALRITDHKSTLLLSGTRHSDDGLLRVHRRGGNDYWKALFTDKNAAELCLPATSNTIEQLTGSDYISNR